jgi:hypothetical protein
MATSPTEDASRSGARARPDPAMNSNSGKHRPQADDPKSSTRQSKARRTALILALVSAGFYVVFFLEHLFF